MQFFYNLGSEGITTATVKNLNVINNDCVGTDTQYCGGIVRCSYGTIINCSFAGEMYFTAYSPESYVGGICGISEGGVISNCYNTGSINVSNEGESALAGGISGGGGTITNCYNTGSISSDSAGGISGGSSTITNCYNTGSVTANTNNYVYAGGISGGSSTITNCYNLGIVTAPTGTTKYIGGISGIYGTCTNCYWASNTASFGIGTGTGTGNDAGATSFAYNASANYSTSTFAEWAPVLNLDGSPWRWKENVTTKINGTDVSTADLPHLYWEYGDTDPAGPILNISSADDFNLNVFNRYYLNSTLTFNQTANITTTNALMLSNLMGTYNGNGFTIHITGTDARDAIFNTLGSSSVTTATVQNLNVINNDCVGTDNKYCGGIARSSYGTITNCSFAGEISFTASSTAYAGGICGFSYNGTITNCYNTGRIIANASSNSFAGGIAADAGNSMDISNCYNAGFITATSTTNNAYAGGIAADSNQSMAVTNCYNTGSVTATSTGSAAYAGGIYGESNRTPITNCYNTGSITANASSSAYVGGINGSGDTIAYCYNLGIVTAPTGATKYIGGINGWYGTCTACYWASNTASFGLGIGSNTGATSFAASGTHSYAQGTFAGWTFGTYGTATTGWVWGAVKSMVINGTTFAATSLPRLWWEEL